MTEKLARAVLILLGVVLGAGAAFLAARYLLPWTTPFLAAWLLAALLEPAVAFLVRRRWRRQIAAAVCTLSALSGLGWGIGALIWRGLSAVTDLTRELPALAEAISRRIDALALLVENHIRAAPEPAADMLRRILAAMGSTLTALPAQLSRGLVSLFTRAAQASPDTLLFLVTAALGTYFFSASFPAVNAFLLAQLPADLRRRLEGLGADLKSGFGGVARSQLILMGMTFFELLIAFFLLRVKGAAALAAVTALVDALPVFGTGTVLVPWALASWLLGRPRRCIGLLVSWGIVSLVRSCAQAKLLGDQIGLDPLASLLSVYVGWRVCGVWGMLLFPPVLMALIRLNDRGVVRLWRSG